MEDKLIEILKKTGLEVYDIERVNEGIDCIVYNYGEELYLFSDNEEDATKYKIILILYCQSDLRKKREEIKNLLKDANFSKVSILPATKVAGTDLITQVFNYSYIEFLNK